MSTEAVIFSGVAIYIAIMAGVGVYASRRTHSAAEFMLAGRSLSLGLCATTIVATWVGGGLILGGSGAAYDDGMLGVIADPFGATLCLLLTGLFFARIFRRLKFFSFIEFVEQRFGRAATLITSLGALASSIFWVSGMLVGFGLIFESLTGTPLVYGIVGGALVVVGYTSVGGMLAVALTDFVQVVIIAAGVIVLFVVVLIDAGGPATVLSQVPAETWRFIPSEHTGERWLNYLRAWFIFGLADLASQSLLQRAMSAKSERVAQNAFYVAGFGYLAFAMFPVMLGIVGSITMPGLSDSESLLPTMAIEHLHPVFVAVFVGALLAAIMSSCDSALLAAATVISTNLLPFVRRSPSESLRLGVARWAIPACGFIGVLGALNARVVFDTVLDANMLMLAAVIVPFILGIWWKKANRAGAVAAMSAGIVAWLTTSLYYTELPGDLIGLGVSLLTMLIVTPLTQRIDPPRKLVDRDGNEVELTNRLGTIGFGGRG